MAALETDLRILVNNQRFSDLRLQCADGSLYAYSGILAARSTMLDHLLRGDAAEPAEVEDMEAENVLLLKDVWTDSMLVTLEFIYTSQLQQNSLKRDLIVEVYYCGVKFALSILQQMVIDYAVNELQDGDPNFAAELLSNAVQRREKLADTKLFRYLCMYLGGMQIDRISCESLTQDALKALLEVSIHMNDHYFASTEYSMLRYVILHSALKVSGAAFELFERQLPADPPTSYGNIQQLEPSPELYQLYQPVAEAVAQYVHALSMERIDGPVLVRLEGLQVIERTTLIKGFRHHAVHGAPMAAQRGAGKCFEWSEMDRGQHVTTSGTLVSSVASIIWQNIRARNPITGFGSHEWVVVLEHGTCDSFGIGVCASADFDTEHFLGSDPNSWIFFSGASIYSRQYDRMPYGKIVNQGNVVRVHLNMSERTLAFSIDGEKYGIAFTGLPDCLYPAISLKDASVRIYRA